MVNWSIRYKNDNSSLWARLITALHCGVRCKSSIPVKCSIGGVWKSIVNMGRATQNPTIDINAKMSPRMGVGDKTLFWLDNWMGNGPLRDRFPNLYAVESEKRCTVQQRYSIIDGNVEWFWGSLNILTQSEQLAERASCTTLLYNIELGSGPDLWLWKTGSSREIFTVQLLRAELDHINIIPETKVLNWLHWIPKKVNCFLWRVVLDRIPTKEALMARRISLPSASCIFCNDVIETVDHLLVTCDFAQQVWTLILQWINIHLPRFTLSVIQLSEQILSHKTHKALKRAIWAVVAATCWNIWRTRNDFIFKHKSPQLTKLIGDIKAHSFLWVQSRASLPDITWEKWRGFKFMDFPL
ncbi:uncharacterized protein LOC110881815 [Helianthus annuus]|uniref:uncharacterized protein LOC110881815 n=1 Tax=Helianthus annuus TaxID=4232 RepID=UPI000B8F92D5|nr:uncharacterized protein LOC110881815 [Helianthus annuus]